MSSFAKVVNFDSKVTTDEYKVLVQLDPKGPRLYQDYTHTNESSICEACGLAPETKSPGRILVLGLVY